ncbi:MAG TPA: TIGR04076 family protein [Candidatus Limnocylindria bacterium]|nr:TIGR04076 family protein [Candidatus Limnocylindria bacterium]
MSDDFTLSNLVVSIEGNPNTFVCSHKSGEAFRVVGENLIFDKNHSFSMYALATLLPFLPAKQRKTDKTDWMTTDELIACPDPNCGAKFKITRKGTTTFSHSEVTKVPLSPQT